MKDKTDEKKDKVAPFSVKFPPELLEKAREKSAATGISIAFVLRKALEEWVTEEKK